MSDFIPLSPEEMEMLGIKLSAKRSPATGEMRVRMTAGGFDQTITTVERGMGGWQKAHSHKRVVEHSRVIRGEVILIEKTPAGTLFCRRYRKGSAFKTTPGRSHTLYITGGTKMVTTKENDTNKKRDWIADKELDLEVQGRSLSSARYYAKKGVMPGRF